MSGFLSGFVVNLRERNFLVERQRALGKGKMICRKIVINALTYYR